MNNVKELYAELMQSHNGHADEGASTFSDAAQHLQEQAVRIAELEQQLADAKQAARWESDLASQAIADLEPYRKDATRYQWLTSREADGRNVPAGKAREMVYKVWNLLTDEQDEMPSKGKIDAAIDSVIQGEQVNAV